MTNQRETLLAIESFLAARLTNDDLNDAMELVNEYALSVSDAVGESRPTDMAMGYPERGS